MSSSNPLAEAAAKLKASNDAFPESMAKSAGVTPGHERTQHEYSAAPYSVAKAKPKPATAPKDDDGIREGLKWRAEQSKGANPNQ